MKYSSSAVNYAIMIPMTTYDTTHIRNFSIVAHIDHGKSTISDRILELTHTVDARDVTKQMLDTMDIEQERGITIKSNAVRVVYVADDSQSYQFNLIDTPGHVDFTYEVSRSLAACEGAVLVVDATQGVEAQTVSNANLAMNANLDIVPAINKIDLPSAHPEEVKQEIEDELAIPSDDAVLVSGKTGEGIHDLLESIVYLVRPPQGDAKKPLKALILDSYFDEYRGVVATVRVFDGVIRKGQQLRMMALGDTFLCDGVGCKRPLEVALPELGVGEVGYVVTGLKDPALVKTGDTMPRLPRGQAHGLHRHLPHRQQAVREPARRAGEAQGERPVPHVDARDVRGAGLRFPRGLPGPAAHGGREGAPGARVRPRPHCYLALRGLPRVQDRRGDAGHNQPAGPARRHQDRPHRGALPQGQGHRAARVYGCRHAAGEPYLKAKVIVPPEYMGAVMQLVVDHRGETGNMVYLSEKSVEIHFDIPLAELILDFFDQLKSRTKGYASLDYEVGDYRTTDLVKLDIMLAGEVVDALSFIVPRDRAYTLARGLCDKLKDIIPRQQFEVAIQGAIGNKIIARSTVRAVRKDVLAKCYGGDISRKRKLLEKQKEGKKRMKSIGSVDVPQEAFLAVLKVDDE